MKKEILYNITGYVVGYCWDGQQGGYPSKSYSGKNLKILLNQIKKAFKDCSLDSGAGFKELISAIINIERVERRIIEKKDFCHTSYKIRTFGTFYKLDEDMKNYIYQVI